MTEQSDAAAERSAPTREAAAPAPRRHPVVEHADGSATLRVVHELQEENTRLRKALAIILDLARSSLPYEGVCYAEDIARAALGPRDE